jgi:hypothetical protein
MPDLKDVEKRIAELKAEIEPTVREIAALEDLARGLKTLGRGEPLTRPTLGDYSSLTMPKAAEQFLTEVPGVSVHYREVAEQALKRGFKGKRTNLKAPVDQIAASFRRMMAQRPDIFQADGRGFFSINPQHLEKRK